MSVLSLIHFTKYLYISQCPCLTCVPLGSQSLEELEHLEIWGCSTLMNLSSSGRLPRRLQRIVIADCPELQSIAEIFDDAMSLEYIKIWGCKNLKCIPEGLHNLIHLNAIYIWDCPNLVSFPEGQLCYTSLTILSVERCMKLRALPDRIHSLYSLKELELRQCPSIMSIEEVGAAQAHLSPNLEIRGCVYDVSFPQEEKGMVLPSSLTELTIARFPRLKHLSSNGFQNLTSLECLSISDCPNLQSFPDTGLPSSLLQLYIYDCPLLKKRCKRDKGEDWSKIADIPRVRIDGRFIYDPK
ncbi:hypothetical protein JRO89_XS05G0253200 [Xanthoceras sorbifolium]|uniref:Disease resistance protein At4g27190-like leucine-rich repeats domain-containing protein n=1 Tax=Xanthoceras sorbifolium TaxID=99658 RepID=A0ABQ8I379_9ROSI|nr:hypothetical protein JRO89_XS05G0253200 [Xanthoceras sorbifolium]